jgi:hypothetical protein
VSQGQFARLPALDRAESAERSGKPDPAVFAGRAEVAMAFEGKQLLSR